MAPSIDREKVIKGLGHCDFGVSDTCYEKDCPYYQSHDCTDELKNDILALLKEQEESIPVSWLKEKLVGHPELPYATTDGIIDILDMWEWR